MWRLRRAVLGGDYPGYWRLRKLKKLVTAPYRARPTHPGRSAQDYGTRLPSGADAGYRSAIKASHFAETCDSSASSAPFVATLVDVTGLVIYFSVAFVVIHGTIL